MVNINLTAGEVLYGRISKFIVEYVDSADVQATIEKADLPEFIAVWQSYKIMTKWIWHLFMHLENGVVKLNELLTLTSVALVNFHKFVYSKYKENLTTLVLRAIEKERDGELIDRTLLQEALQVRCEPSCSTFLQVFKQSTLHYHLFRIVLSSLCRSREFT